MMCVLYKGREVYLTLGWGKGLTGQGDEEFLQIWSDGDVLYTDRDLDYMDVCIYQNSSSGILKICALY